MFKPYDKKILQITLAVVIAALSADALEGETKSAQITQSLEGLRTESSLKDRAQGFIDASRLDEPRINQRLVELLDSKDQGGKYHSVLVAPAWIEVLLILSKRFPESEVVRHPLFDASDREKFKSWWRSNKDNIEYLETGGHRLRSKKWHSPR